MARKHKPYRGVLAEPMLFEGPVTPAWATNTPPSGWPAHLTAVWPAVMAEARAEDVRRLRRRLHAQHERIAALFSHFEIDRTTQGADLDLALSLAMRHEPALVQGERVHFANLCQRFNLDPEGEGIHFQLVRHLASEHVPGFKTKFRASEIGIGFDPSSVDADGKLFVRDTRVRFAPHEIFSLVMAFAAIEELQRNTNGKVSDRDTARTLLDYAKLRSILTPNHAAHVSEIIRSRGNDRQGHPSAMSDRAIRDYISFARSAVSAYRAGEANTFQLQMIEAFQIMCSTPTSDRAVAWADGPPRNHPENSE